MKLTNTMWNLNVADYNGECYYLKYYQNNFNILSSQSGQEVQHGETEWAVSCDWCEAGQARSLLEISQYNCLKTEQSDNLRY